MASSLPKPCLSALKNSLPSLLQSTATAYTTLGTGILALEKFQKVSELLDNVICSLKQEHENYDDLLKVLTGLAVQYQQLSTETKSHLRTVKEQACANTKIIEEAKQQLFKGNAIASYVMEIEETAKHSLESSEELRSKYDVVIYKVKACCSQAKAGYERNEHKADIAEKGASVGLISGIGVGGGFAAFQIATKALVVFGMPGAIAGGVLGLIGGCLVGGMAGGLPFTTAEALFRKYAEKFKILDVTLSQIDKILLENFEVMTEICRLLGKLKKVARSLAEMEVVPVTPTTDSDELDDTNIDFLIRFRFDEFKRASENLEKNCDYLLDDMPLQALSHLSIDSDSKSAKNKLL